MPSSPKTGKVLPFHRLPSFQPFTELSAEETSQALCSSMALASFGIATLRLLECVLPAAAGEVERESQGLTEHFLTLADYVKQQGDQAPPEVQQALQGIVMRMQFQDRNTQMLENTIGILEQYRGMLESSHSDGSSMQACDILLNRAISTTVETILANIRLSDIRNTYAAALHKANVHPAGASEAGETNKDIELF